MMWNKIKCFLGFHCYEYITCDWGIFSTGEYRFVVWECWLCGKTKTVKDKYEEKEEGGFLAVSESETSALRGLVDAIRAFEMETD